jgi:hypothetical protein
VYKVQVKPAHSKAASPLGIRRGSLAAAWGLAWRSGGFDPKGVSGRPGRPPSLGPAGGSVFRIR